MSQQFKIAIDNKVEVPVKFTLKAGKVNKTFAFTLHCNRLEQEEINTRLEAADFKFKSFMVGDGVVTGWEGQRLVLNVDDTPAEFSEDALGALLSIPGVAQVCFGAYQKECGAKEKN